MLEVISNPLRHIYQDASMKDSLCALIMKLRGRRKTILERLKTSYNNGVMIEAAS
jgi:hypothetical protein